MNGSLLEYNDKGSALLFHDRTFFLLLSTPVDSLEDMANRVHASGLGKFVRILHEYVYE